MIFNILPVSGNIFFNDYNTNELIFQEIYKTSDKVIIIDEIIGDIHVRYWEHCIDGMIVKNDYILLHLSIENEEILKFEKTWTDLILKKCSDPPELNHEKYFWKKAVVFPDIDDLTNFYNFDNDQEYPLICWEIRYIDGRTILYDSDDNKIGSGIPAPSKGFSISGYHNASWPDPWLEFRRNAGIWFSQWCNTTNSLSLPSPSTISSYVSNPNVTYFYELAHGDEFSFQADTIGSSYTASIVQNDMSTRQPMEFAFIGSCHGMTSTGPGTFSYKFRKGQMNNTVAVGYNYMESCPGWEYALPWQNSMFEKMNNGETIKNAFDMATSEYPTIAPAVVFIGDQNLIVPQPPDKPTISGKKRGKSGEEYEYTFTSIDPNEDDIYFFIEWGDNKTEEWIGSYMSGEEMKIKHTFSEKNAYLIRAKSKDIYGAESEWSTLEVSIPKNRIIDNLIFEQLLTKFPILKYLL